MFPSLPRPQSTVSHGNAIVRTKYGPCTKRTTWRKEDAFVLRHHFLNISIFPPGMENSVFVLRVSTRSGGIVGLLDHVPALRRPTFHSATTLGTRVPPDMPETFKGFIEGFGPGPRGEDCLVCLEPLNASKPTVTHQDGCGNTLCRQCFMSNVIHSRAARPIQHAQCSACRALIEITTHPISRIERIGTNGLHVESFWPRLGGNTTDLPLAELSPDILLRAQAIASYDVSVHEHDECAYLERAIICPFVEAFLDHVIKRGGYLKARDAPGGPSRCRYIRYHDCVTTSFARWLHADRDVLHSRFVRWLLRDSTSTRLDPDDEGLHSLVWRGVIPPGSESLTFAQAADRFNIFRFASNYYLVPESPPEMLTALEAQFWTFGDRAWRYGWTQQGEELSRSFTAAPIDGPATPFYCVRLGAVGPLPPSADTTYILRTQSLRNTLEQWPGDTVERKVVFGPLVPAEIFGGDYEAASRGMPGCSAVAMQALLKYLTEKYARAGVNNEHPVTEEEDIIPPPVPGRMRTIVGSGAFNG